MIDTHCHLTDPRLGDRLDDVLAAAAAAGVTGMISIATTPADAAAALAIAEQHDHVYATVGVHPLYAAEFDDDQEFYEHIHEIAPFIGHPKVVALGEMGLDHHYDDPPRDVQRATFARQLDLARTLSKLPIIIHNREATDDVLAMLREAGMPGERYVFHCFTGSVAEVDRILDFGAAVGFTGVVTFSNAKEVAEAADRVPLDRLLIETDAPYLTPEPHRKVRVNEPRYVADVARFLAAKRGLALEAFVEQVDANARRIFPLHEHAV